jgi:hypothetical protein
MDHGRCYGGLGTTLFAAEGAGGRNKQPQIKSLIEEKASSIT